MDSLLRFLKNIHFQLIFIALEVIALILAIGGDAKRNSVFCTSANFVTGRIYDLAWNYVSYFNLREENAMLMEQLSNIRRKNSMFYVSDTAKFQNQTDSLGKLKYRFITASVLKNSINSKNNFMTLDVGEAEGVHPDMAVVSASGAVGIVVNTSEHFSLAISLLNNKVGISAKLKNSNFYGKLNWTGEDYHTAILHEIPNHVILNVGDTVVTSGYSAIFPPGIPVAVIDSFERNSDDNFYSIKVKFTTDLKCLANVFVIENLMQDEQYQLEEEESKFVQ
ncbi:MAG: rod shape-determining protein MreC [Bacteroidales bacterium]|jgi:rod shape-determining protein MreC|nr:rod shape-determining protein MreC [Bacteroidales bacterium]